MYEAVDYLDIGTNLPWQGPVGAILSWGVVLCLCLLFLQPQQPARVTRAAVSKRRSHERR
jgi:hypothetical protein